MENRTLGSGGGALEVSAQGLGCLGMSQSYGQRDDEESMATIRAALDLGVTLLDTANVYGPYINEELIGRAIAGRRDEAVVSTKFGFWPGHGGKLLVQGRPEHVRPALEGSLQRLGVDHLDLYYLHRVDPSVSIEDTWGAMRQMVEEGKVRHLGMCEAAPETISRAHAIHPVTAVQTEWSLWTRDVEVDGVLETVRRLGIGFVAYSPLGRGFLSGTVRRVEDLASTDSRRSTPRFQGENFDQNLALAGRVQELAAAKGVTPSQLALAWLSAQGQDVVPIPGTKRRRYLQENVAALPITLSPDERRLIEEIAPVGVAAGDRYPAELMSTLRR